MRTCKLLLGSDEERTVKVSHPVAEGLDNPANLSTETEPFRFCRGPSMGR
jgi:hypothetical protein